jgi:membrane protein YqaA with SNARE-associated domain
MSLMRSDMNYGLQNNMRTKASYSITRTCILILEITIVLSLLIAWLAFDSLQKSKSLLVLFFYCFPSEFLIGLVPHEPVLLYFGRFYSPFTVAIVSGVGTVLAEAINYSFFNYFADIEFFKKIIRRKSVTEIIRLFKKYPFIAIWIAGFTPVPFYPFRFLVVISHYHRLKYLTAVLLSRTPRFFILAQIGYTFEIPGSFLLGLFLVLIVSVNVPLIRNFLRDKKTQ